MGVVGFGCGCLIVCLMSACFACRLLVCVVACYLLQLFGFDVFALFVCFDMYNVCAFVVRVLC